MTLRARLSLAFVLVVVLPLLVGGLLVQRMVPASAQARQERAVVTQARLVAGLLSGACARARTAAEALARAADTARPAASRRVAVGLVAAGQVDGAAVLATTDAATDGTADATTDGSGDGTGSGPVSAGVRVPAAATDCASAGPATTPGLLTALVPLVDATGAPAGRVVVALRADDALAARLRQAVGRGTVALLAGDTVVGRDGALPDDLLRSARATPGSAVRTDGDVAVLLAARAGQPYAVLVAEPRERVATALPALAALLAGAVLLAVLLALLLARAVARPLAELGQAAGRVAAGDLSTPVRVGGRDEVGQLAAVFGVMTENLRRTIGDLSRSRDELRSGLGRLGETLAATHDLGGMLSVVLDTALGTTGARSGMVLLLAEDRSALLQQVGRGLPSGPGLRMPVGAGVSGRVLSTGRPVLGDAGELTTAAPEPAGTNVLAVPLATGGATLGVLALFDAPGGFDEPEVATVRTLAGQAAVAVDNILLHRDLQRLAVTDPLTGVGNRRSFDETLPREIERAARFGRPLGLLMLDLDRFKAVNDTYGHPRGDAVLAEVAARLRSEVRDIDLVARYGGEEIVVLLPETSASGAARAAARICLTVRAAPFGRPGEEPLAVTVSAGVAVFPAAPGDGPGLVAAADEALYAAKQAGRDTWRMWSRPRSRPDRGPH